MANKNNILSIPLNGELCLNKNKVDITQFTGWNRVNGPIYGGCLSPLYSMQKTFADVWDRNGNYFNIDNGEISFCDYEEYDEFRDFPYRGKKYIINAELSENEFEDRVDRILDIYNISEEQLVWDVKNELYDNNNELFLLSSII